MPGEKWNVDKHKKGLTPKQKRQWIAAADAALARCKAGKVKPEGNVSCEGYAVKVANAAVSNAAKRDWSLDERAQLVRSEFSAEFNNDSPYVYAGWVFEDYLIARSTARMYRVEYTFEGGDVEFADRSEWVEVEHEFKEVGDSQVVGSPIRAVEGKPGRYMAYAVLFNDGQSKDMYNTYFDRQTDYRMDLYPQWPWLYHHMMNKQYGPRSVGVWDEKGIDDVGVFVEGEITAHDVYRQAVEQLIDEEVLFTSSQAIHSGVRVAKDGHVEVWPICEVSSTVSPGDWRMEKPISPVASRAIEVLESGGDGGNDMQLKDELLKLLEGFGANAARDASGEDEEEQQPSQDTEGEEEVRAVDANAVAEALVEMIDFKPVIAAVRAIDETLKEQDTRLQVIETAIEGLAQTEPERMKAMLAGERWYENLFVASRDAPAADDTSVEDAKQQNTAPVDSTAVFGAICASGGASQ